MNKTDRIAWLIICSMILGLASLLDDLHRHAAPAFSKPLDREILTADSTNLISISPGADTHTAPMVPPWRSP